MEQQSTVNLWLVPLEPETGGWCEKCLLPSLIRIRVFQLMDTGPGGSRIYPVVSLFGTVEYCDDHDEEPRWVKL